MLTHRQVVLRIGRLHTDHFAVEEELDIGSEADGIFVVGAEHEALPGAPVADALDLPRDTVKSRMRYALERLQQQLEDLREQAS